MWQLLSSNISHIIFHGQSLSPLGSKEAHRPFTQFLAEFKTDPPFITPLPPSIYLSPQTTNHWHVWGVCTQSILSNPPSASFPLCLSSLAHICLLRKLLSHTFSRLLFSPLTLPLHPFFLSCLRVVSCDQSGGNNSVLGCGDWTTSISERRGWCEAGGGLVWFCVISSQPDNNSAAPSVTPSFIVSPRQHFSTKPPTYFTLNIWFFHIICGHFSFFKRVVLWVNTHMSGDVGSDLSQDVLPVHKLDPDGHHRGLWEEKEKKLTSVRTVTPPTGGWSEISHFSLHLSANPLPSFCFLPLTFVFVFDEALKDEDEVEVVLRVTQRQHGDASHACILLLGCQRGAERLCTQDTHTLPY